jgi:hypothetical protein
MAHQSLRRKLSVGKRGESVFVTLLRDGVDLILANRPWRWLRERAEKIPGDKKHVQTTFSQSHCVALFKTAHSLPSSSC